MENRKSVSRAVFFFFFLSFFKATLRVKITPQFEALAKCNFFFVGRD